MIPIVAEKIERRIDGEVVTAAVLCATTLRWRKRDGEGRTRIDRHPLRQRRNGRAGTAAGHHCCHYAETFDVNVKGTILTVQKGMTLMGTGGSIIMTGSTTGVMGTPAFTIYSASKAAARNLARSWAQDLRGTGIRVNVLSPGPTLTELVAEVVGREAMIEMGATTPIGHIGDPSEVAAAAAFLASSDSSFMTGSELFIDGGLAQI